MDFGFNTQIPGFNGSESNIPLSGNAPASGSAYAYEPKKADDDDFLPALGGIILSGFKSATSGFVGALTNQLNGNNDARERAAFNSQQTGGGAKAPTGIFAPVAGIPGGWPVIGLAVAGVALLLYLVLRK